MAEYLGLILCDAVKHASWVNYFVTLFRRFGCCWFEGFIFLLSWGGSEHNDSHILFLGGVYRQQENL